MGLVLRPAPSIGELRSGSPRLLELNDLLHHLHKKKMLEVLSFCETKVTPIVEGYGGCWAFQIEIVPIESAYPGLGQLVISGCCSPLLRPRTWSNRHIRIWNPIHYVLLPQVPK
ncbi:Hypothetical predicted protein [Olea europaea subsp. europaea]|uniref:Uncharacterized protein n=1 Tax=Olea europaea subsp. europaea TaxID=158383 RepID=A0A8S0VKK2_OLEEU|nr:Hypothetical predicted protein [Olea europaea subsp. europaea]